MATVQFNLRQLSNPELLSLVKFIGEWSGVVRAPDAGGASGEDWSEDVQIPEATPPGALTIEEFFLSLLIVLGRELRARRGEGEEISRFDLPVEDLGPESLHQVMFRVFHLREHFLNDARRASADLMSEILGVVASERAAQDARIQSRWLTELELGDSGQGLSSDSSPRG